MDTITHALTGSVIGYALKEKYGWAGFGAVVAASVAPDMDMPLMLVDQLTYLQYHRVVTNSVVGIIALSLIVAYAAYRIGHGVRFRPLLALSFTGVALHVFMDLTNSYGSKLLWPFSQRWYSLDTVFIVDPLLTGLLILSLVIMRFGADRTGVLIGCFMLLCGYWGIRYYEHGQALKVFRAERADAEKISAYPAPLNPFVWHMVAEDKNYFFMGWYNLKTKNWYETETAVKEMDNDGIKAALASKSGKVFMEFARFPYVSYDELPNGWLVHIQDLRFTLNQGDKRFVLTQRVDKGGNVLSSEFEF